MSKWCILNNNKTSEIDVQGRPYTSWQRHQHVKDYLNDIIEQHDPAGFIIASGSESDIKCIYGIAISVISSHMTEYPAPCMK